MPTPCSTPFPLPPPFDEELLRCKTGTGPIYLVFYRLYPFYPPATTAVFGSYPGSHKGMSSILADHYSALVYERKCGGGGEGCGVSANEYSCAHEAQINFVDLTPYLTYGPTCHISTLNWHCIIANACLIIWWERFRGTQKEDDRGPLSSQSSLM
jgi:hypothetical protein